eukprot:TRINITY_DN22841_c0_g1_i1.p1 TRINITY_DN22841_c0_g1~~TRINITY_DN22841_c0_g1_i1.p1  ORF type:complete len:363 (-),score=64.95 TRINITY_DN22841_c0_g1_i1:190-1278(-)
MAIVTAEKARAVRAERAKAEAVKSGRGGLSALDVFWLTFCVSGIWGSYLYQGVLQEALSTKKYGLEGVRFKHLAFLNLAQSAVCLLWSLLIMLLFHRREGKGVAPVTAYWLPGITNSIGPALGIEALKYISYPAQVLAKSSKMVPVMLSGAIYYRVQYSPGEYLCTILIAAGVSIFALFKSSASALKKLAKPNAPWGYGLCMLNLIADGYTNAKQDDINKVYPKNSSTHMMVGMNTWGTIYMGAFMFLVPGGGGMDAIRFCQTHRDAAFDILMFCLCGAVGQNFIFLTITKFGALANSTITTIRKFVSILISSIWSGSPLSLEQWSGVLMVFTGLSYQIYLKSQRKKKPKVEDPAGSTKKDS